MKRKFSMILIMILLFTGGFLSGMWTSNNKPSNSATMISNVLPVPISEKNPVGKVLPELPLSPSKVLTGYVQDFRDPDQLDMTHLTHVIFSFAHPTKDGELLLNGDPALNNLRHTVKKAHGQNKKAILAVGGWYHIEGNESYDHFKSAIENDTSRTKLVKELMRIVEKEDLDGIDIDFEHPRSNQDARYLTLFIQELSQHLKPKQKELSVAVNAKIHSVAGTELTSVVYEPAMFEYVDRVHIMAYDGQWDGGYNAANLSSYTFTENIVQYWTNLFNTHQIPKEKLVLGVPFYAQPVDPDIKQVSYAAIVNHDTSSIVNDTVEMNGTTYHFNGLKTMERKTTLALQHGFGGMMIWEVGHDTSGTHSLTAAISDKLSSEVNANGKLYTNN